MIIKSFVCENLGGLVHQELELKPGMNVICGPNEAGKSTVVEGILGILFRSHRLRKTTSDREFEERFRPYPHGDSIKCRLTFLADGQEYQLSKEWGGSPQLSLTVQGQLLKEEKGVLEKLRQLLRYGEGTYSNVVFARQRDLRVALEKLQRDEETSHALSDVLHKAVLALDGVSLERLKKRIEEEYTALQGHWDIENRRPEKGRDLDDPWKTGRGLVLDSYYRQDELRRKIILTRQLEDEYSSAVERLQELNKKRAEIKAAKNKYAALEDDVSQRILLETEINSLEKELNELKEIIQLKPAQEAELTGFRQEIERLTRENSAIRAEIAVAERIQNGKAARELLERSAGLRKEIAAKEQALAGYPPVTEDQLKRLEELYAQLTTTKAALKAATLQASLKKAPQQVFVTRGLKDREIITSGSEFAASGFFRLETEDGLELEVRAGKIDFYALSAQFTRDKEEYQELLNRLKIADLQEAQKIFSLRTQLGRELQVLETKLAGLEQGRDMEALKQEVSELDKLAARPLEELANLLSKNEQALQEANLQAAIRQNTIEGWLAKYGDLDKLLEIFAQCSGVLAEKKKKLSALAPLPEEFASPQAFKEELACLRKQDEDLAEEEQRAQKTCFEKERQLPDISSEELQGLYKQARADFERLEYRLQKIKLIREVFQKKSEEIKQESYQPLLRAFSRYLSRLTQSRYEIGEVRENLEVRIARDDRVFLPSSLLSTGTADAVLLALRLALVETIFPHGEGLVVLDDCLVNLDPGRKEQAAQVLREFAERYQVIFTTCDPQTAQFLGGNVINLAP